MNTLPSGSISVLIDFICTYPHIEKDHLVKLLKQLIRSSSPQLPSIVGGDPPNAADVPTLSGSGSFSLIGSTFDRSGRYVITGSDDRLVKIWSMETTFCLASCWGHDGDITDLAVSSNNVMVASSSNDFIIRGIFQPLKPDEDEEDTTVDIMYPLEPPVVCEYDWELVELEDFTDELIKEAALPADQKDAFKEYVKDQVTERKKAQRPAKEARKKTFEDMNPETRAAFKNMRFYKFYPVQTTDTPDISNVNVSLVDKD